MATQAEIDAQRQQLVEIRDDIRASRSAGTLSNGEFRRLGQKLLDRNRALGEMAPTDVAPIDPDFRPISQVPTGGEQLGAGLATPATLPEARFLETRLPPSGRLRSRLAQELGQFQTGLALPESQLAPGIGDRLLRGLEQIGLGGAARTVLLDLAQAPNIEDAVDPEALSVLEDVPRDVLDEIKRSAAFIRVLVPGAINVVDQAIAGMTRFGFPKATAQLPRVPLEVRQGLEADPRQEEQAESEQMISDIAVSVVTPSIAAAGLRGVKGLTTGRRILKAAEARGLRTGVIPLEPPAGIVNEITEVIPDPLRILAEEPVRIIRSTVPAPFRRRITPSGLPTPDFGDLPAQSITAPGPFRTVKSYVPAPTAKGAQKLSNAAVNAPYQTENQVIREARTAAESALGPGKRGTAAQIADDVAAHAVADREILRGVVAPPPGGKSPGRLASMARMAESKVDDLTQAVESWVRQEISPEALRLFDAGTEGAGSQVISRVISAENQMRRQLTELWFTGRALPGGARARGVFEILKPLTDKEALNVFDVVTKGAKPVSGAADEAAKAFRFWNEEIISEAIDARVLSEAADGTKTLVRRRERFMPNILTEKAISSRRLRGQLARDIARANNITIRDAEALVKQIRRRSRFGKSASLNFRREVNVPERWLEKDVRRLMPRYYTGAWREIAEARWYGGNFEIMDDIIRSVDDAFLGEGVPEAARAGFGRTDFELMTRRMSLQMDEAFTVRAQNISRAVRGFTVVTSMHRSAISTIADFHKLPVISRGLGIRSKVADTVGGIVDSWKEGRALTAIRKGRPGAQQFHEIDSIRAGVSPTGGLVDRYTSDIIRFATEHGDFDVARGFLRLVQHEPVELFARRAVVGTSRRQAERLVKHLRGLPEGQDNPYARMVLTELLDDTDNVGAAALDMERALREGLSPGDLDRIGANGVRRTQPLSITDIPHHLMTPIGRARGQFKATLLKEFRFTRDTVVKDARLFIDTKGREGSIKGLLGWFVTGQALGFTIVKLKNALGFGFAKLAEPITGIPPRRRKKADTALAFMLDNMLQVGGIAYPMDFMSSLTINPRSGVMAWVIGPGFSKLALTLGRGVTQGPAGAIEQLVPVDLTQRRTKEIPAQADIILEGLGIGEEQ